MFFFSDRISYILLLSSQSPFLNPNLSLSPSFLPLSPLSFSVSLSLCPFHLSISLYSHVHILYSSVLNITLAVYNQSYQSKEDTVSKPLVFT